MWSLKESYNRLSQSKWDALFKSFELSKDVIEFNSSMILLKNSNGIEFNTIIGTYSVDLINKYRFFDYISPEVVDLCSKIDLLTLHLFGSDLKNHYIKPHINDPIADEMFVNLYGTSAIQIPPVPYEIFDKYLEGSAFSRKVGYFSSSISNIDEGNNAIIKLGLDYIRCFWFFASIDAALLVASMLGATTIIAKNPIVSNIRLLSKIKKMDFIVVESDSEMCDKTNAVEIIDLLTNYCGDGDHPKILLNVDLAIDTYMYKPDITVPISVVKTNAPGIFSRDELICCEVMDPTLRSKISFSDKVTMFNGFFTAYCSVETGNAAIKQFLEKKDMKKVMYS